MYTHVHSIIIHNNRKVGANQVSISTCISRMWYINGILFVLKNEENYDTHYNMDGPLRYYGK